MSGKQRIYLSSPHMSDEGYEQAYIKEAFDTNWIAPLGNNVNEFEKEFAAVTGAKDAAALSSGTAAMHMALKAAGAGPGDIVFCPTLTFAATVNPVIYQGAVPVFIDSDYETWNISPSALARAFQIYPQVKAVIIVHLYGLSAKLDEIMKQCRERGVAVIEDAAESLGTLYHGCLLYTSESCIREGVTGAIHMLKQYYAWELTGRDRWMNPWFRARAARRMVFSWWHRIQPETVSAFL